LKGKKDNNFKALPEIDSEIKSAINSSRGAVLKPFPILLVVLTTKASSHPVVNAKNDLHAVDTP
jgi:hypothetical protein